MPNDLGFQSFDEVQSLGSSPEGANRGYQSFDELVALSYGGGEKDNQEEKQTRPKIGVGERARLRVEQETGEKAEGGWDTARGVLESVTGANVGRKIDAQRREAELGRLTEASNDEINSFIGTSGLSKWAKSLKPEDVAAIDQIVKTTDDPQVRAAAVRKLANDTLAGMTERKKAASERLETGFQPWHSRAVSYTVENAGYMLPFAGGGKIAAAGKLTGLAKHATKAALPLLRSGVATYKDLTADTYDVDDEGNVFVASEGDSGGKAALKAAANAGREVAIEMAGGEALGWVFGKAAGKSVSRGMKNAMRAAVRRMNDTDAGRAVLGAAHAYQKLSGYTQFQGFIPEMFEEELDLATGVFGLDKKDSENKGIRKASAEYWGDAKKLETHTEIALGLLGTFALQGGISTVQGLKAEKSRTRAVDNALRMANVNDETIAGLNAKEKDYLYEVFIQREMEPEKAAKIMRRLGGRLSAAADEITEQEGYRFDADRDGIKPNFKIPGDIADDGLVHTDPASGIGLASTGDGRVTMYDPEGGKAEFASVGDAVEAAKQRSVELQVLGNRRANKMKFVGNAAQRLAGNLDLDVFDSVKGLVQAHPELTEKPNFNPRSTGVRMPSGKIALVLDNIRSPQDALRTIMHEAGVHEGLRKTLGSKEAVEDFAKNVGGGTAEEFEARAKRLGYSGKKALLVEEGLAHAYENRTADPSTYQDAVSWLRGHLRKVNPKLSYSDSEIEVLMWEAQQSVMGEGGAARRVEVGTGAMEAAGREVAEGYQRREGERREAEEQSAYERKMMEIEESYTPPAPVSAQATAVDLNAESQKRMAEDPQAWIESLRAAKGDIGKAALIYDGVREDISMPQNATEREEIDNGTPFEAQNQQEWSPNVQFQGNKPLWRSILAEGMRQDGEGNPYASAEADDAVRKQRRAPAQPDDNRGMFSQPKQAEEAETAIRGVMRGDRLQRRMEQLSEQSKTHPEFKPIVSVKRAAAKIKAVLQDNWGDMSVEERRTLFDLRDSLTRENAGEFIDALDMFVLDLKTRPVGSQPEPAEVVKESLTTEKGTPSSEKERDVPVSDAAGQPPSPAPEVKTADVAQPTPTAKKAQAQESQLPSDSDAQEPRQDATGSIAVEPVSEQGGEASAAAEAKQVSAVDAMKTPENQEQTEERTFPYGYKTELMSPEEVMERATRQRDRDVAELEKKMSEREKVLEGLPKSKRRSKWDDNEWAILYNSKRVAKNWRGVNHPEIGHRSAIELAIDHSEGYIAGKPRVHDPVNAAAVDAYGIKLPEGYVRDGDLYVFKGEAASKSTPSKSDAKPSEPVKPVNPTVPTSKAERAAFDAAVKARFWATGTNRLRADKAKAVKDGDELKRLGGEFERMWLAEKAKADRMKAAGRVKALAEAVGIEEAAAESIPVKESIARAEADTATPTEGQKEAGNYKKGRFSAHGFDIVVENPVGSVRSGVTKEGKPWRTEMKNTYGYFAGEADGKDGDKLDVFLGPDVEGAGNVYVVDQIDPSTGEFDEHKVMLGFADESAARAAYEANYQNGWKGLKTITGVSLDDFRKWVESSNRKLKPFSEYAAVKSYTPAVGASGASGTVQDSLTVAQDTATAQTKNRQSIDKADPADDAKKGTPRSEKERLVPADAAPKTPESATSGKATPNVASATPDVSPATASPAVKVETEPDGDKTVSVPSKDKPSIQPKEQKKFLLAEIDKALEMAPDNAEALPRTKEADEAQADYLGIVAENYPLGKKPSMPYNANDEQKAKHADKMLAYETQAANKLDPLFEKYGIPEMSPERKGYLSIEGTTSGAVASSKYDIGERYNILKDRLEAIRNDKYPTLTIEVPGDGEFTVINDKSHLSVFRDMAKKRFPASMFAPVSTEKKAVPDPHAPVRLGRTVGFDAMTAEIKALLQPFASKDQTRKPILNPHWNGAAGEAVATDGKRMAVMIGKKNAKPKKDDSGYPNYTQVVPGYKEGKVPNPDPADALAVEVDSARLTRKLIQALSVYKDVDKAAPTVKLWLTADGTLEVSTDVVDTGSYSSLREEGDGFLIGIYNPEYMMDALTFLRKTGNETPVMYARGRSFPMIMAGKSEYVVQMPLRLEDSDWQKENHVEEYAKWKAGKEGTLDRKGRTPKQREHIAKMSAAVKAATAGGESVLPKPATVEFKRTTPEAGTSERATIDSSYETLNKAWEDAVSVENQLEREFKYGKYGANRDKAERKWRKAQEATAKAWNDSKEARKLWARANAEDDAQSEDPLKRLSGLKRTGDITDKQFYDQARELYKAEFERRGLEGEQLEDAMRHAANDTQQYKGMKIVADVAEARSTDIPRKKAAVAEVMGWTDTSERHRANMRDRINGASIWPEDLERVMKEARDKRAGYAKELAASKAAERKASDAKRAKQEAFEQTLREEGRLFYIRSIDNKWTAVEGDALKIKTVPWADSLYIRQKAKGSWTVSESRSGNMIAEGTTRTDAIKSAESKLKAIGPDKFAAIVEKAMESAPPRPEQKPATDVSAAPSSTPAEAPATAPGRLEDFGEKIGGARKDVAEDEIDRVARNEERREARREDGVDDTRFRRAVSDEPMFFSQLRRTLEAKMPNRMTVMALRGMIDPAKGSGVKADEIEWTGLKDFLDSKNPGDYVTKAEVLEAVRDVEIQEVVKGNRATEEEIQTRAQELFDEALNETMDRLEEDGREVDRTDISNQMDWGEYVEAAREEDKDDTNFSQYQLAGGKNYRELLLTLPAAPLYEVYSDGAWQGFDSLEAANAYKNQHLSDPNIRIRKTEASKSDFRSSHFNEPNILAHVRFNERQAANGDKTLFLEEVQSDWHQAGREQGYATQPVVTIRELPPEDLTEEYRKSGNSIWVLDIDGEPVSSFHTLQDAENSAADWRRGKWTSDNNRKKVPDAPFKDTSKGWARLAFKRMLRWGAENGFDRVAWTTGEQQAERYDLSKKIERVSYNDLTGQLMAWEVGTYGDPGRLPVLRETVPIEKSADYIGKEAAQKLIAAAPVNDVRSISGDDLRVGGEGMRTFYDQILPSIANDIGKKFGARVEDVDVGGRPNTMRVVIPLPSGGYGVQDRGSNMYFTATPESWSRDIEKAKSYPTAREAMGGFKSVSVAVDAVTVHSIPVTPAMRDSVMQGQPMFRRRAVTHEQDAEYMAAVKSGDIEKAQRMVDEAARAAGYDRVGYHGSRTGKLFHTFSGGKHFFSSDPEVAKRFAQEAEFVLDIDGEVTPLSRSDLETLQIEPYEDIPWHLGWNWVEEDGTYAERARSNLSDWFPQAENAQSIVVRKSEAGDFVLKAYLKLGDFGERDYKGAVWQMDETAPDVLIGQRSGFVAKNIREGGPTAEPEFPVADTLVVASPSQIKSADPVTYDDAGNVIPLSERFNPDSDDTRFRRVGIPVNGPRYTTTHTEAKTGSLVARFTELHDAFRTKQQDYLLPAVRLYERVQRKANLRNVPRDQDFIHKQRVHASVFGAKAKDIDRRFVDPMTEEVQKAGMTFEELHEYAAAVHAPFFNRMIEARRKNMSMPPSEMAALMFGEGMADGVDAEYLAEIIDNVEDGWAGQGLSDENAAKIVSDFEAKRGFANLKNAHDLLISMNRNALETRVNAGLMSRAQADTLLALSPFYVPLHVAKEEEDGGVSGGGRNLGGREFKRAVGHFGRENVNSVAQSIIQAYQAEDRALENEARRALADFLEANPDDSQYVITGHAPKKAVTVKDKDGTLRVVSVPRQDWGMKKEHPVVTFKRDGARMFIEFRGERKMAVTHAVKGDNVIRSEFLSFLNNHVMRFFKVTRTALNPEFFIPNISADFGDAMVNLTADGLNRVRDDVIKQMPHAWKIIFEYNRGHGALEGKRRSRGMAEAERFLKEAVANGMMFDSKFYNDTDDVMKDLEKRLQKRVGGKTNPMSWLSPREDLDTAGLPWMLAQIDRLNSVGEMGTRLSVYMSARKNGMGVEQAVELARNVTVDFHRKGEWTPVTNTLYAFSNVGIQATYRMGKALLTSKSGHRVAGGLFAAGFLSGLIGALLKGDDDDEENGYGKLEEWWKQGGLVLPNPFTGNWVRLRVRGIPAAIIYAGMRTADTLTGYASPMEAAVSSTVGFVDSSFNFLGTSGSVAQLLMPTLADPFIQSAENRDAFGNRIVPASFNKSKPESEQYRKGTSKGFVNMSRLLNSMSGGDSFTAGGVDVSPETLRHWTDFVGGGSLKFVTRSMSAAESALRGEEMESSQIPIVRSFVFSPSDENRQNSRYYEAVNEFEEARYRLKGYTDARDRERKSELIEAHPYVRSGTADRLLSYSNRIKKLRELEERTGDAARRKELAARRLELQTKYIRLMRGD